MDSREGKIKSLFIAASEIADRKLRQEYINSRCADDDALRRAVEELLRHAEGLGSFLELPPTNKAAPLASLSGEISETTIGPYRLVVPIGEGGMGAVYLAEQEFPVRRQVALKVIKLGMDSAQVIARFEAERQALAMMDHPNIAKVFDAGTTDSQSGASGRPYFVMELVRGVPITRFCDEHRLSPRERLELFIPVCHAIHHAHQKGVIHRDVKPSNVLVTLYDNKPVPKVIDFGIAKAIEQRLTDRTLLTGLGSIVGTLEYMAPEQAEMTELGVDTRSDIYSLGVVLYELLTGTTPLNRRRMKEVEYLEVLRLIREEDPPKPSTRLNQSEATLPSVAAIPPPERGRLAKLVRGELDWIVMKALEKDRSRRYASANDFARDVERFLNDEPLEAGPPSAAYRLKKLARKYRRALAIITSSGALLVIGTGLSLWQAVRATRAEKDAIAAGTIAESRRVEAAQLRDKAIEAQSAATAVVGFFQDRVLASARPKGLSGGLGVEVTVRDALRAAEPGINESFAKQPAFEASIRNALGETYAHLGEPQAAVRHFERSLELCRQSLGNDHDQTLATMNNLANALEAVGRVDEALARSTEALQLSQTHVGRDHERTLTMMHNLAARYMAKRQLDRAVALYEDCLDRRKAALGSRHNDTITTMGNLAVALHLSGNLDRAIPLYEGTLKLRKETLPTDHPNTLATMNNLAAAYQKVGRFDEALPLYEDTLKLRQAILGPNHRDTLSLMNNLAGAYRAAHQFDQSLATYEKTLELRKARFGADDPDTLTTINELASTYRVSGKLDRAVPLYEELLERTKAKRGADHGDTLQCMSLVAELHEQRKEPSKAESIRRECLAIVQSKEPDGWTTCQATALLGSNLLAQQKYAEAEGLLTAGYEGMKRHERTVPSSAKIHLAETAGWLVQLYEQNNQPDKAAMWKKELEARRAFQTSSSPKNQ